MTCKDGFYWMIGIATPERGRRSILCTKVKTPGNIYWNGVE